MRRTVLALSAGVLLSIPGVGAAAGFSGGYVGGSFGVFTSSQVEITDDAFFIDSPTTSSGIEDAIFTKLDGILGFGTQNDGLYFGGEFTYTFVNNLEGTVYSEPGIDRDFEADDGWSMGLRVGLVGDSQWMGYGKVAYGSRTFEQSITGFGSDDEEFSGPGLGLGAEFMVSDGFSIRMEAIRFDYSSETVDGIKYDPTENSFDIAAVAWF